MRTTFLLSLALAISSFLSASQGATRDPAQFDKEIRAFEAMDRTNLPPAGGTLFVGSSSIRLWTNLPESFPKMRTINRGFGGSHLPDSIAFAEKIIIPYRPAKIVLYAGENDIARGDSPEEVYASFREFVHKIHQALPKTPIYYISIKPAPVRWHLSPQERTANRLIQKYCDKKPGLHFIDVWPVMLDKNGQPDPAIFRSDNLHMNEQGYRRWTDVIGRALAGS